MRTFPNAAVSLLLALTASPAAAQEREWVTGTSETGVEMMYGTTDSDDILFAIRCDAKSKEIFVGFAHMPIGVRNGDAIDLTLVSEAGETVLPSQVTYLEPMDIWLVESTDVPAADLRRIVTGGSALNVMVQDGGEEIPLAGAAEGFEALFSACGPQ